MRIVILAAGKGTRINLDVPKVLAPLAGRTMIEHVVENALNSGVDANPVIVIGHRADDVRQVLEKYPVDIVYQEELLGTGHAVMTCQPVIEPGEDVLVLGGDHPLIAPETIRAVCDKHEQEGTTMTFVTYTVPHFEVHGGAFKTFGRIIRNDQGRIERICETADASSEELAITEVNPGYYAFSGDWLFDKLASLETDNAQGEYYLTDIVKVGMSSWEPVAIIEGKNLHEAIGINTQADLAHAEGLIIKNQQNSLKV